jgi:glycogen debranching enzyme
MTQAAALESILRQLEELRDPAGFFNAGIPNYDHLFGRDAAVSALQMLHREPDAARATLLALSKFQGTKRRLRREEWPGKIMHEHYPYGLLDMLGALVHHDHRLKLLINLILWRFPYYGSVDAGAWYLILLHHYYRRTGDAALVKRLWPSVRGVLKWYDYHATHKITGLVTFRSHFTYGLKIQSWKDGMNSDIEPPVAMVEVQGYYYYALLQIAELAQDVMDSRTEAAALRTRAETLKAHFQSAFKPGTGPLPMAIDGNGHPYISVASNPGHLLFTGILDRRQRDAVVQRLFAADMITPYGVRTESTAEPTFDPLSYQNGSVWPFDNWVIHQGLIKTGYKSEAERIKKGFIEVFEEWELLPELYGVDSKGQLMPIKRACRIQAWSAGALINVLEHAPAL